MRKFRWGAVLAVATLVTSMLTVSDASAHDGHRAVTAYITGQDSFPHPGLLVNTYTFPHHPIVVAQGGTITFVNQTDDAHTMSLFAEGDVPETVDQVMNCGLCNSINTVYGIAGGPPGGLPAGVQLDNGVAGDDESQADADLPDTGAIATISPALAGQLPPPSVFPILIADFDTVSHSNAGAADTVGDSTLVDTAVPGHGVGFASQRTVVVTAAPGLYQIVCTIHPWMQGTIKVVGRGSDS